MLDESRKLTVEEFFAMCHEVGWCSKKDAEKYVKRFPKEYYTEKDCYWAYKMGETIPNFRACSKRYIIQSDGGSGCKI